ncbi:MAG: UbiA family prenyltransferase [Chitinophagales bacterium]|nr:UbiA family prenyltransferase [Chitinophagales bacterium]
MANLRAFRVDDWWRSKAAMLMGMVYLFTLWFYIPFAHFAILALLSLATICGFAATGYLLNDFFDRAKDLKAGKRNFLVNRSPGVIVVCFTGALLCLLFPWLYLPFTTTSAALMALELSLLLVYSLPPIRLKEKGLAGIVTDALYAHTVPVVLAAYTFSLAAQKQIPLAPMALLIGWQTLSGVRNILLHQHDDLNADAKAGSKNWVASITEPSFLSSIKILIVAETLTSLMFFGLLAATQLWFLMCVVLIATWAIVVWIKYKRFNELDLSDIRVKHYPNNVYEKWLPVVVLLILAAGQIAFAAVLVLHLLLFNLEFYIESYKVIYPVVRDNWISKIQIPMRRWLSVIINYPIYYSFLLFGVDLKKENQTALGYFKKKRGHNK